MVVHQKTHEAWMHIQRMPKYKTRNLQVIFQSIKKTWKLLANWQLEFITSYMTTLWILEKINVFLQ